VSGGANLQQLVDEEEGADEKVKEVLEERGLPGTGGLLVTAIQRQDNPLVQALVLIYSSIGIVGLLLGDILMALFDPRIKFGKRGGAR
jgi:ABC-type microcin C transport system permease subunit YejB